MTVSINPELTGTTEKGQGRSAAIVSFTSTGLITETTGGGVPDNAGVYDINIQGDRAYISWGSAGSAIIDITTPATPSVLDIAPPFTGGNFTIVRDSVLLGSTLVTCSRGGTAAGDLVTFDVSADTVGVPSGTQLDLHSSTSSTSALYSAIDTDGVSHVYASGQQVAIESFDGSNPAAITSVDSNTSADWETQGNCVHNGYFIGCNYGDGDHALRSCTINEGTLGSIVNTPSIYAGGIEQRPWACVASGDRLYVSNNESGSVSTHSGLTVFDITDLSSAAVFVSHTEIDAGDMGDKGTAGGAGGDTPNLGISKIGHLVFLANGDKGVAVFDVRGKTPNYIGTFGDKTNYDNVMAVAAFEKDSEIYVMYGDGVGVAGVTMKTLIIDKVNIL